MKTLLAKTVIANIRNRAASQIGNYAVIATDRQYLDRWYTVTNRANASRSYSVDMFANTCTCEAFKREGYCKHYAMAQMERASDNRIEAEAAKVKDPDFIGWSA